MNKTLLKIFGIILGIIAIIMAFIILDQNIGYYEGSSSYGGDAYTGIQNAAAQTANNVMYVGEMIQLALGFQMLITGLTMLLGSICIRTKTPAPAQKTPTFQPCNYNNTPSYGTYTPPVTEASREWYCTKCGTPNEAISKFCYACGTPKDN